MSDKKDIDFVIAWVDGSDKEWQKLKALYENENRVIEKSGVAHYRDWGILRYWFRAVEKYAPWVRKVHFITCGQKPEWLNLNHSKLNFVKHEDYIPHQWLPTFSSHPIELNIFRIEGLSEQFVYFNDDMFLNAPVKPEDFFVKGLPCDCAGLNPGPTYMGSAAVTNVTLNNLLTVSKYFKFRKQFKANFTKWINLKYGSKILFKTLLCFPFCYWGPYLGIHTSHSAISYLKSTFIEVWEKAKEDCELTSSHRFRDKSDVNQWLMEYWQIMSGNFYPRRTNTVASYGSEKIDSNLTIVIDEILKHRHKIICVNDGLAIKNFDEVSAKIREAYSQILPKKSSFEIY